MLTHIQQEYSCKCTKTTTSGVVHTFPALQSYSMKSFTAFIMPIVPILFVTFKKDLKSKK
jgi:hypothetical protein